MKMLFVNAKAKRMMLPKDSELRELPERIALFTTTQHLHEIPRIKEKLEGIGKQVKLFKGLHSQHEGQTLGCDVPELEKEVEKEGKQEGRKEGETGGKEFDCALFAGSGLFHPKALLMATEKPVYTMDLETGMLEKLDTELVKRMQGRRKAALAKFYTSERIGMLVTIKTGQERMKRAMKLQEQFPDKKIYVLAFDTLDFSQMENFPFVECFVNTGCPRIMDDWEKFQKPVVNLEDITGQRF